MEKEPLKKRGRPVGSKSGVNYINRHFRIPSCIIDQVKAGDGELSSICRAAIDDQYYRGYDTDCKTVRVHVMITPRQDAYLEGRASLYGTKSKALSSLIAGYLHK